MKKSELEICAINDFPDLGVSDLEKRELNLNGKSYEKIYEQWTTYIKFQKTEDKFYKKRDKLIIDIARKYNADLAVIKSTHEHYPDSTTSQKVVFYRKN